MTENKRFKYYEHKGADYILENPNDDLDFIEMLGDCLDSEEIVNRLNELYDENEQLKSDKELFAQCICNLSNLLCENKIEHNVPKNIEDFISVWGVRIE